MIQLLNPSALWLADPLENRIWVLYSARDHLANQLVR
jgi:hypothetical protein